MQDQTSRIAAQLLRAALAHFDSERQNALAVLDVYLHKPTAISDHSQLVQEIVPSLDFVENCWLTFVGSRW